MVDRGCDLGQKRKTSAEPGLVPARSSAADIVALVIAAARKGVGDLLWLGYNPKSNSKSGKWGAPRVKFGTQLICHDRLFEDPADLRPLFTLFDLRPSTSLCILSGEPTPSRTISHILSWTVKGLPLMSQGGGRSLTTCSLKSWPDEKDNSVDIGPS